jgi:tetratricopeptide (TPR) repeat protein
MNRKQVIVIAVVVAISGYLYSLPVKGLIKSKTDNHASDGTMPASKAPAAISHVTASGDADKLSLQKQLAKQWDDDNQPAPSAFYYLDVARKENTFENWMSAGSRFNDAYRFTQDTVTQPAFVENAIEAYKNAVKLKPENTDAKTGLGIAYVNQTSLGITDPNGGSPMQGIMLLLDVVKQDPNNRNANLNLGLFAMKSGQFDKAVTRFKTVIAQKAEVEPYFYLAESYKQLGMKKEAIEAYQKCKEMIPDPVIGQKIDQYIKELKN